MQNSLLLLLLRLFKSCYITPIIRSLHWLRITECIKYKLLSFIYKVLTTTQPPYLHNLISVQRPRSSHSASVITLVRPPTLSSLPGERDNARNNVRCMQEKKTTHSHDGQRQYVDRTSCGRVSQNDRGQINGGNLSMVWPSFGLWWMAEEQQNH